MAAEPGDTPRLPPAAKNPAAQTPAAQTPAAQTPAAQTPAAQTTAAQPPSPAGDNHAGARTPGQPSRILVLTMIVLTAAIFVGLFSILYARWASADLPSSVLIVVASPAFEGAVVQVSALSLAKPYAVIVRSQERQIPFYLDQGTYTLRVQLSEQTIYTTDFFIGKNEGLKIDLHQLEDRLPPRPATTPAQPPSQVRA